MSDTAPETTERASEADETREQAAPKPTETVEFWKQKAREQEKRAKENAEAAKRAKEYEDAQKTAEQRLADREREAEKRVAEAEARALRREVAIEHRLSSEDAALLDDLTDEDAMRRFAARLAAAADAQAGPKTPKPNPAQREGDSPAVDDDAIARAFFGIQ